MSESKTQDAEGKFVTPGELQKRLQDEKTVLIDVREPIEFAGGHIKGAQSCPLDKLDPKTLQEKFSGKNLIFSCQSGARSDQAVQKFKMETGKDVGQLQGGFSAWESAGLPIERLMKKAPISIFRQVMIASGSLVLLGLILGLTVHPAFLTLTGFVGAGLIFAGVTGFCGMAKILGMMPWNRVPENLSNQ